MVSKGEFLEYVHVFNMDYYGTPRSFVEEEIALGHDVLLEIDVQGAMRVRETYPDAVLVFIAPPSMGKLKSAAGRARAQKRPKRSNAGLRPRSQRWNT